MIKYNTLPHLMSSVVNTYNNPKAFNYLENGEWRSLSTLDVAEHIQKISLGLHDLGIKKGDGVGIISDGSPFWIIMDLSVMIAGGITIPMFANVSKENLVFQIKDSNLKYLFIASEEQWHKLGDNRGNFKNIITLNIQHNDKGPMTYQELMERGERVSLKDPSLYANLRDALKADDIATIIYTSGSTGTPKGVELTHKNLCSQIDGANECFPLDCPVLQ